MDADTKRIGDPVTSKKRRRPSNRPSERPVYPRKRAAQACHTCRLRRTKCDNAQPACSSCNDLGTECVYQEKDKSTFDLASLAILQRLDGLEELIRSGHQQEKVISSKTDISKGAPSPTTVLKDCGSPTLERTGKAVSYQINVETILQWPIFQGKNLGQQDLRQLIQSRKSYSDTSLELDIQKFDSSTRLELFDRFVNTVHIYNPILEEAVVRDYIESSFSVDLGWDARSCLVLLIYALGFIAAPTENRPSHSSAEIKKSSAFQQGESCFLASQKMMGTLLCRTGILEAQCFFLSGVYLMNIFQPIEAWRMFVQALSCCQACSTSFLNDEQRQLQESIYWTCFKSELELRLNLNLAEESVWDLTYPAFFPSPPKELKTQNEVVWYFYLAEIALRRLGNRILNFVYKLSPLKLSYDEVAEATSNFEDQAQAWMRSLPVGLRMDTHIQSENEQHSSLRFVLEGHLLDCYEVMYWPFVVDSIHKQLPYSTLTNKFVRKGLQLCVDRIRKNESGFYSRHHGTWFMLRSCTRSALVLIAAARCGHLEPLLPKEWLETVEKVIALLKYWKDEARDSEDRFNILERELELLTTSPLPQTTLEPVSGGIS